LNWRSTVVQTTVEQVELFKFNFKFSLTRKWRLNGPQVLTPSGSWQKNGSWPNQFNKSWRENAPKERWRRKKHMSDVGREKNHRQTGFRDRFVVWILTVIQCRNFILLRQCRIGWKPQMIVLERNFECCGKQRHFQAPSLVRHLEEPKCMWCDAAFGLPITPRIKEETRSFQQFESLFKRQYWSGISHYLLILHQLIRIFSIFSLFKRSWRRQNQ
jgi:hypothetical protein